MDNVILKGYLIKDVLYAADIETILFQIKQVILDRADIAYEKLLKWQIERNVDEITIGRYKRPEDISILNLAENTVRGRIIYAERTMQATEFNFYIGGQLLMGKISGKPVAYLKIIEKNGMYDKVLKKIPELIPFDIKESDLNKKGEKKEFWDSVQSKYQIDIPIIVNLINYSDIYTDVSKFEYRSKKERAADLAKEQVLNQLLAAYGRDAEIPPAKLMEYTLQAMNRLNYKEIKEIIDAETVHLTNLLPDIDYEMISKIGIISDIKPEEEGIPMRNEIEDLSEDD